MNRNAYLHVAGLIALSILSVECASRTPTRSPAAPGPVATTSAIGAEETAIRGVLSDVEVAMEERDMYKVLAHVSASYHDKLGRDYTDIRRFLQRIFDNYASMEIALSGTKVTIDENQAAVTGTFVTFARGRSGTTVNPLTLRGRTSVFLEKIADRWLIVVWGEAL